MILPYLIVYGIWCVRIRRPFKFSRCSYRTLFLQDRITIVVEVVKLLRHSAIDAVPLTQRSLCKIIMHSLHNAPKYQIYDNTYSCCILQVAIAIMIVHLTSFCDIFSPNVTIWVFRDQDRLATRSTRVARFKINPD